MAISPQHRITTSGQSNQGRFLSGSQHQDWRHLYEPEMLGKQFGMWTVVTREIQRRGKHHYTRVRCACGVEDWKVLDNLKRGRSKQCNSCAMTERHRLAGNLLVSSRGVSLLQKRAVSILQRCNNPNDKGYAHYGSRGITCEFESVKELVEYLLTVAPAEDWIGKQIDRIDNDKGYVRGNIRCATSSQNSANRRITRYVTYRGQKVCLGHVWHLVKTDHPNFQFTSGWTVKLIKQGVEPDQLPTYQRVGMRRCTTYSMPDPAIVSLYRTP